MKKAAGAEPVRRPPGQVKRGDMGRSDAGQVAPPPVPGAHQGAATEAGRIAHLIAELQGYGMRAEVPMERRHGGAGPADAGMLWIDGVAATVPTGAEYAATSPYVLRAEDDGWGIYRDGQRLATAQPLRRPRYYDLRTADGIPYWKIALLHLDSVASTVIQTCAYWGNADQCAFCGIGVTLANGRTIAKKTPQMLAEVAIAARDLDGAVDATLTTGTTATPDKGALYVARCGEAIRRDAGLPVEVQFEPPADLDVIDQVAAMGIDSVGIHVESFDPAVLARVAPAKARTGIDGYFRAWQRAVAAFGEGQVSSYVILGMGEDPDLIVEGCRRAIDIGVYPFVVPLRPTVGSLMERLPAPPPGYTEAIYRRVAPYLRARGLGARGVAAGCARCQACSAMSLLEGSGEPGERTFLPIVGTG
jgi:radical SAM protein (TIGR04043 family)